MNPEQDRHSCKLQSDIRCVDDRLVSPRRQSTDSPGHNMMPSLRHMMPRLQFVRATWTVADQGVVSLGAFLANIALARQLPPAEYGTFAILFGSLLSLQLVNACLLFHPVSVRLVVATGEVHATLLRTTLALVLLMCVPLSLALAGGLLLFDRADLVMPTLSVFVLWQVQESMRRSLFASFRHRAAVLGDAISYVGQAAAIIVLAQHGTLSIVNGLYCMALTSGLGALVQAYQLGFSAIGPYQIRQTANDYWSIGGWWSLGNGILGLLRLQVLAWVLAITSGPAAAASLQAAANIVNVANPVLIGLCNVIPQTAAHSHADSGHRGAWHVARSYMLIGIPPLLCFYGVLAAAPDLALRTFYPAGSPYLQLSLAVQLLVFALILSYGTEMFCSFLHGVAAPHLALFINAIGALVTALLAVPMVEFLGLRGACLTLVASNAVRLAASYWLLRRLTVLEQLQAA